MIPDDAASKMSEFSFVIEMMKQCWNEDSSNCPSFMEIVQAFQENGI